MGRGQSARLGVGRRAGLGGSVILALIVSGAILGSARAAPVAANPVDADWAPPPTVYIPETGHIIDRLFLDLWRASGGPFAFGNPITREIEQDDGRVVQYYEFARFEYWPGGNEAGQTVSLGQVGAEMAPPPLPRRQGGSRGGPAAVALTEAIAWRPRTEREATALAAAEPSYRFVAETGHGVWGGLRGFWEATGEANYLGHPVSEEYQLRGVSYQVFERGKLRWRAGEEVAMVPVGEVLVERYGLPTRPERRGNVPVYDEAMFIPPVAVPDMGAPPVAPPGGRSVIVSLSQQAMWAFDGNQVVRTSYVSTGTEEFRTPTGLYSVSTKIDSQTMEGVLGGEYYNVPDVPYVMYFTDRGHAIHGTYWHENFGTPMSHGCVNLPMDVAEWIYGWAPVGLAVLIVE